LQKNDAQASIARFFCIQFFCLKSTNLAAGNSDLREIRGGASMSDTSTAAALLTELLHDLEFQVLDDESAFGEIQGWSASQGRYES
jgi:hypothetical protein